MTSNEAGVARSSSELREAVLICNAKSRRGREWFPRAKECLKQSRLKLLEAHDLRDPSKMRQLVKKAVADEVPLIVIGGGDGSMSATASLLKGSKSVLGVLPLGTGNAFARDLGIPSDVEGACDILARGIISPVDLGRIGNRHFVNVATIGLTTRIAEALTDEGKKRFGRLVYVGAILKAAVGLRPFRATVSTDDGATHVFDTMQLVFGSGRYHAGPFPVTPDAEITDHLIHGYALKGTNKASFVRLFLNLWRGHHVVLSEVETFSFKNARVETKPKRRFVVDGEIGERAPVDVSIDPAAIRVVVSPEFPGSQRLPEVSATHS